MKFSFWEKGKNINKNQKKEFIKNDTNFLGAFSLDKLFSFLRINNAQLEDFKAKEKENVEEKEVLQKDSKKENEEVEIDIENKKDELFEFLNDKVKNTDVSSFDYWFYKIFLTEWKNWKLFSDKSMDIKDVENIKKNIVHFEKLDGKEKILQKSIRDHLFKFLDLNEETLKTVFYYYQKFKNEYNLNEEVLLKSYKYLKEKGFLDKTVEEQSRILLEFYKNFSKHE